MGVEEDLEQLRREPGSASIFTGWMELASAGLE